VLKLIFLPLLCLFFSPNGFAGLTAEQVLGEYWKDPLFGEAASEATIFVDLVSDDVWPPKITVPLARNIRFVFLNKSKQPHLMAFSKDIRIQLADERFQKFVDDELFHSQQKVIAGLGHSHASSSVDDAQALVKTLDQWPTVFVKPEDRKEILIRFDELTTISFTCALGDHEEKEYKGLIEIVKSIDLNDKSKTSGWQLLND